MKLYIVFAMDRSGHHGVVNWICKQHANLIHLNNPSLNSDMNKFISHQPELGKKSSNADMQQDLLINLEQFSFTIDNWNIWENAPVVNKFDQIIPIIVIRRFKNWLASVAKHPGNQFYGNKDKTILEMQKKWDNRINTYRQHLDAAMGKGPVDNILTIRFDHWFSLPNYRKQLAEKLNIPFTDAGLNDVPSFAGGSSFDKRNFNGKAQKMNVLERWKESEGSEPYDTFMKNNHNLNDISEKFFSSFENQRGTIMQVPGKGLRLILNTH